MSGQTDAAAAADSKKYENAFLESRSYIAEKARSNCL
jgi:hypothetical protein